MHGETPRDSSTVGRFPSVTLGAEDDAEGEEAGPEESEAACRRWLRKLCPCCPPKPNNDMDETLVTVTDGDEKEVEPTQEKPETGGSELEGERAHENTGYCSAGNAHDLTVMFP